MLDGKSFTKPTPGDVDDELPLAPIGVIPIAILGTADFDVLTIPWESVLLNGVRPRSFSLEDFALLPCVLVLS